jgi:predicted ATP-dependent endonuclease of OLD family
MILYIWIQSYKNDLIKNTGFNLSSKFDFDFKITSDIKDKIIKGDLTYRKIQIPHLFNESIEDLKVIVGKNGSGKSSLLRVLIDILLNEQSRPILSSSFFIVIKEDSKIKIIHSEKINIKFEDNNITVISTQNGDKSLIKSHYENTLIVRYSPLFTIDNIGDYGGELGGTIHNYENGEDIYDISTENQIVSDVSSENRLEDSRIQKQEDKFKSDLLIYRNKEGWRILAFLLSTNASILDDFSFKNEIPSIMFNIKPEYENEPIVTKIQRCIKEKEKRYRFNIPLSNKKMLKKIAKTYSEYLTIDFTSFSGGEHTILSFFSRMMNLNNEYLKEQNIENILLVLDEPDLTLHPEWQKSLINILDKYLPSLFENVKFQVLITSHSPILLSDLPNEHVLFLEKKDGLCNVIKIKELTFGANIHSLYAHAFFLSNGKAAMGDFAKNQIEKIINDIKDKTNLETIKERIKLIGESLIRNQLEKMYDDKMSNPKLTELESRVKELEEELDRMKNQNNSL